MHYRVNGWIHGIGLLLAESEEQPSEYSSDFILNRSSDGRHIAGCVFFRNARDLTYLNGVLLLTEKRPLVDAIAFAK
jgi:hypothetical protein